MLPSPRGGHHAGRYRSPGGANLAKNLGIGRYVGQICSTDSDLPALAWVRKSDTGVDNGIPALDTEVIGETVRPLRAARIIPVCVKRQLQSVKYIAPVGEAAAAKPLWGELQLFVG